MFGIYSMHRADVTPVSSRKRGRNEESEDEDNSGSSSDEECPICRERFDAAHRTPCHHKFCLRCIEQHLGDGSNRCPGRNCERLLTLEMLEPVVENEPEPQEPIRRNNNRSQTAPESSSATPTTPAAPIGAVGRTGAESVSRAGIESVSRAGIESVGRAGVESVSRVGALVAERGMEASATGRTASESAMRATEIGSSAGASVEGVNPNVVFKALENMSTDQIQRLLENMSSDQIQRFQEMLAETTRKNELRADNDLLLQFMDEMREKRLAELNRLQREVDVLSRDVSILRGRSRQVREPARDLRTDPAVTAKLQRVTENSAEFETLWFESQDTRDRNDALDQFSIHVNQFTKYSKLRLISSWRHRRRNDGENSTMSHDMYGFPNIVSSIELDRDGAKVATAGVLRQLKIFDVSGLMDESIQEHYPIQEISTQAKLSSLSWNKYNNHQLISSDYGGVVTLWDAERAEKIHEFEEHAPSKIWSVDYSRSRPRLFASGSDDATVKIWDSYGDDSSIMTIAATQGNGPSVCCVKFSPEDLTKVVFGCADRSVHCYDLRQTTEPLYTLRGHEHAVSYVAFMSRTRLVTASTDSTLRLWDVENGETMIRSFTGHRNATNFVGLSVTEDYIACGSEDNKVYTYYKGVSKPCISYPFGSSSGGDDDLETPQTSSGLLFVSAVSWHPKELILFAANSQGSVRMLRMEERQGAAGE